MKSLFTRKSPSDVSLYNEQSFYLAFRQDLTRAKSEVIIESPFITTRRVTKLLPVLRELRQRGVAIIINTRDPIEHDAAYEAQALASIKAMQSIGIEVLYTARHHRKLAIIDRQTVWNGSLNILSHSDSSEVMWRMQSEANAQKLIGFINLTPYTGDTL